MMLRRVKYNTEREAKPKPRKLKRGLLQFLAARFRQREHHYRAREQEERGHAERAPHAVTIRECADQPRSGSARRAPDVVDHTERGSTDALREQLRHHRA